MGELSPQVTERARMLTILSFLRETPDPQAGQIPDLAQHTAPGWGFSAVGGTMAASAAFFFA